MDTRPRVLSYRVSRVTPVTHIYACTCEVHGARFADLLLTRCHLFACMHTYIHPCVKKKFSVLFGFFNTVPTECGGSRCWWLMLLSNYTCVGYAMQTGRGGLCTWDVSYSDKPPAHTGLIPGPSCPVFTQGGQTLTQALPAPCILSLNAVFIIYQVSLFARGQFCHTWIDYIATMLYSHTCVTTLANRMESRLVCQLKFSAAVAQLHTNTHMYTPLCCLPTLAYHVTSTQYEPNIAYSITAVSVLVCVCTQTHNPPNTHS